MNAEVKGLVEDLSKVTQAIGRRIASPKNDLDDLAFLAEATDHVASTLRSIRNLMIILPPE